VSDLAPSTRPLTGREILTISIELDPDGAPGVFTTIAEMEDVEPRWWGIEAKAASSQTGETISVRVTYPGWRDRVFRALRWLRRLRGERRLR
jgi:hypothetical protein